MELNKLTTHMQQNDSNAKLDLKFIMIFLHKQI